MSFAPELFFPAFRRRSLRQIGFQFVPAQHTLIYFTVATQIFFDGRLRSDRLLCIAIEKAVKGQCRPPPSNVRGRWARHVDWR
jgi:hypothetical protein